MAAAARCANNHSVTGKYYNKTNNNGGINKAGTLFKINIPVKKTLINTNFSTLKTILNGL